MVRFVGYALLIRQEIALNGAQEGRLGRRDTAFLIVIGIVFLLASAVAFYVGRPVPTEPTLATADKDVRRFPLPAGPRKYQ